jgi:ATP-dependent Clp protease ATP-binding subunit ClpA
MLSAGLHPIFVVISSLFLLLVFLKLYGLFAWSMPIAFGISLATLAGRFYILDREWERSKGKAVDIDFKNLRTFDIRPKAPKIREQIRGQDEAVSRVIERIHQRIRGASPKQTLGAFFLVGPTGTGKTYLGELINQALYPDSEPVILRMNQYKHPEDVYTLIGPPPGQPGYEVGGTLTRPVLHDPYRVVILDEIDKAHPDVRHCLYDILDTAVCREKSSGKNVYFSACVFFATCNAGTDAVRAIWEEATDPIIRTGRAREALSREGFEKPLLARFNDVLLMDRLRSVVVAEVACLQIANYWKRYDLEVVYTAPEILVETIKRNVEFEDYGVRQIANLIQEMTADAIEKAKQQGARRVQLFVDMHGKVGVRPI